MEILHLCRHKTAGWEGVICQRDDGRHFITNGLGVWTDSEERRAALEVVSEIQPEVLRICLRKFPVILRF